MFEQFKRKQKIKTEKRRLCLELMQDATTTEDKVKALTTTESIFKNIDKGTLIAVGANLLIAAVVVFADETRLIGTKGLNFIGKPKTPK